MINGSNLLFPWEPVRDSISAFLSSLRNKHGEYRLAQDSDYTLMASAFSTLLSYTLGLSTDEKCTERIKESHDTESGYFLDPKIDISGLPPSKRKYLKEQTTYFCRSALRCVGCEKEISFVRFNAMNPKNLQIWLESLDWDHPWDCCNEIMFVLDFLLNPPTTEDNICLGFSLLNWLIEFQRSDNGFWGSGNASLLSAMCGSVHFYPFIIRYHGVVGKAQLIRKSTLSLQNCGGFFYPVWGGGACPDYDGIATLVWIDALGEREENALRRAFGGVCNSLNENYLFVEAHRLDGELPTSQIDQKLLRWVVSTSHSYSGWKAMMYIVDQPNIWACWLRSLSIGMIQLYFGVNSCVHFMRYPGIGWIPDA